jgi:hypothetical protein
VGGLKKIGKSAFLLRRILWERGSPPTNAFLLAKLKVSVFKTDSLDAFFLLRKIFFFCKKNFVPPFKTATCFFEKRFFHFLLEFFFFRTPFWEGIFWKKQVLI